MSACLPVCVVCPPLPLSPPLPRVAQCISKAAPFDTVHNYASTQSLTNCYI